jgi:CRISPR-associated protein Cas2
MRLMVMFDLPVITIQDRREYRKFRKYLTKNGFLMMQESIYTKLVPNDSSAIWAVQGLVKNKPVSGLVQVLRVTEKQFSKMDFIVGEYKTDVLESDERIVFL